MAEHDNKCERMVLTAQSPVCSCWHRARIAELEADLAEWQKKAAAAVVLHEKIHECDDLKTDCERLREDAQPTNGQLSEMAYILHLVPRGDIVPVQILAVLAKQFNAALAARREKT